MCHSNEPPRGLFAAARARTSSVPRCDDCDRMAGLFCLSIAASCEKWPANHPTPPPFDGSCGNSGRLTHFPTITTHIDQRKLREQSKTLLSRTQGRPGRTLRQEQQEIYSNHRELSFLGCLFAKRRPLLLRKRKEDSDSITVRSSVVDIYCVR